MERAGGGGRIAPRLPSRSFESYILFVLRTSYEAYRPHKGQGTIKEEPGHRNPPPRGRRNR